MNGVGVNSFGAVVGQYGDALGLEPFAQYLGGPGFLAGHQAVHRLHEGDLRAEPGERLPQLAPDRPAAEYHQEVREFGQLPDGVAGQRPALDQAGDRHQAGEEPVAISAYRKETSRSPAVRVPGPVKDAAPWVTSTPYGASASAESCGSIAPIARFTSARAAVRSAGPVTGGRP